MGLSFEGSIVARFTRFGFSLSNATSFVNQTGDRQIVDIRATGISEVAKILKELPEKTMLKVARKTMRQTLEPLFREVQSNTPVGKTGKMKESVKTRIKLRKSSGWLTGSVVADGRVAPHYQLVDLGWKLTGPEPKKKFIKRISGRRIMKGALEGQANSIIQTFSDDLKALATEAQSKVGKV